MAIATLKAGFYGTTDETYYLDGGGRAWVVVSVDDLSNGPVEIRIEDLPIDREDFMSAEGMVDHKEATELLAGIERKFDVKLRTRPLATESKTAAILAEIERALGDTVCSEFNVTGTVAYYDDGEEKPWRIADDWASESYATPEEAIAGAEEWVKASQI